MLLVFSCETFSANSSQNVTSSISSISTSTPVFSDFYEEWINVKDEENIILLGKEENPRLIRSSNLENDLYDIVSDNYSIIGKTSFNGPMEDITNDILNQCKKNGTTLALYSIEYAYTTSGTYGIRRYNYDVYYLAKCTDMPFPFGLSLVDLSTEDRQNFERNTGAKIIIVYKNTPAFFANFLRGDIIININDHEIINANDFSYYYYFNEFKKGDEVRIQFIRKNQIYEKIIEIK